MGHIENKIQVLKRIAAHFNENHITWNLGASANLYLRSIIDNFNDLDIMILEKDVDKVQTILSDIALLKDKRPSSNFGTKVFLNYEIDGIDIDIMAGFAIKYQDEMHAFPLREDVSFDTVQIDDVTIYLEKIEVWLRYYELMERHEKVSMIKQYIKEVKT